MVLLRVKSEYPRNLTQNTSWRRRESHPVALMSVSVLTTKPVGITPSHTQDSNFIYLPQLQWCYISTICATTGICSRKSSTLNMYLYGSSILSWTVVYLFKVYPPETMWTPHIFVLYPERLVGRCLGEPVSMERCLEHPRPQVCRPDRPRRDIFRRPVFEI